MGLLVPGLLERLVAVDARVKAESELKVGAEFAVLEFAVV